MSAEIDYSDSVSWSVLTCYSLISIPLREISIPRVSKKVGSYSLSACKEFLLCYSDAACVSIIDLSIWAESFLYSMA